MVGWMQAGGGLLDAATLRSLADAVLSGTPQPGTQAVDLAQNLLRSNPSSDALVRQLAQMQMQNQQVNYQQQVRGLLPVYKIVHLSAALLLLMVQLCPKPALPYL